MQSLTYIEIDVDYCSRTYGVAPCTASIPTTGAAKCYNTKRTCQDRTHFSNAPVTLRFAVPADYLPRDIECIPNIKSVALTPAVVSMGENLGTRATLTVKFGDHRHSDTGGGGDKYLSDRAYDPYNQGTFWGRFRARQPFLFGRPIRLIRGVVGQAIADMETWNFVIDSTSGPNTDGTFTILAKDLLKLADNSKSQAPKLSNGYLSASITNTATSATLSPSGIGNSEYPSSGYCCIGGSEICAFTRFGDVMTLTRGQYNTSAAAHSAQDRVQIVLRFVSEDPADIISTLLQSYAGVQSSYVPLADWKAETSTYLQTVYTGIICEPTGVQDLVSELIEQAALAVWWDPASCKIRMRVIRPIPTTAYLFEPKNIMANSVSIEEQADKRKSQVWTYFAQRDPTKQIDDKSNYMSCASTVDLEAEADYGTAEVKEIFSRWIPLGGRAVALKLNALQLGRFRDPPRRITFDVWRHGDVEISLGGGYKFQSWPIQDTSGAEFQTAIQVVRLDCQVDKYRVESEEMLFTEYSSPDPNDHYITIDVNQYCINIRNIHDTLFPSPTSSTRVFVTVETGVIVGSTSTGIPSLDVGTWPTGVTIEIVNNGRIQGAGGQGGHGGNYTGDGPWPGNPGGVALYARRPITLKNNGQLFGGGGGGGGGTQQGGGSMSAGGGGGGGAGTYAGYGGARGTASSSNNAADGASGTAMSGGSGGAGRTFGVTIAGTGGDGGGPGQPGQQRPPEPTGYTYGAAGGAAGAAIDGNSYVIVQTTGDLRGPRVN